MFLKSNQIA